MLLFVPRTIKYSVVLLPVNVGVEGVDPLSCVHPEKLLLVRFNELNHKLALSIPRTTTYIVLETTAAVGLSNVLPSGRLFQLFHEAVVEL